MDSLHTLLDEVLDAPVLGGLTADARAELFDDINVVRKAVLASEEPRIALVGKASVGVRDVLADILSDEPSDAPVSQELGYGRWYPYHVASGTLHVLDLRRDDAPLSTKGLQFGVPDAVIGVAESGDTDVELIVEDLIRLIYQVEDDHSFSPAAAIGIYRKSRMQESGDYLTQEAIRAEFHKLGFDRHWAKTVLMARPGALVRQILPKMPEETRMVLARMSSDPRVKTEITDAFVRLCASINATVATIPLPVASTLPITSVQVVMIAGIAYVSGRELNTRTVAEFMAALGLNVASGLALRELARTLAQLVPVVGPFVSAAIAGKATQVIGRSAQEYFIKR